MKHFYKYPRTPHLPWSMGSNNDDKFVDEDFIKSFNGRRISITEKMDGENTNMYPDRYHARSIDSMDHQSRHYVKGIWGRIKHEIPRGWRICGENMYAKHSIYYDNLDDYFLVFSIWNDKNVCLSWKDTKEICNSLSLSTVPEIKGINIFNENELIELSKALDPKNQEGYVIRYPGEFPYKDFKHNVAKYVRENHITTNDHWMFKKIEKNKLRS